MPRHKRNHLEIVENISESYLATAEFFLSLSNPTSLMIVDVLHNKEMTPAEVSKEVGINTRTAAAKMRVMEYKGILVSRVGSKETLYRLAELGILEAFDRILKYPERRLKQTDPSNAKLSRTGRKGN